MNDLFTFGGSAVSDPFHLDKVGFGHVHQFGVVVHFLGIPAFDQRQSVHGSLAFARELLQTVHESLPKVPEQRSVDLLQGVLGGGVDGHIELSDGTNVPNGLRKLSVRNQEARDGFLVEKFHKPRVEQI